MVCNINRIEKELHAAIAWRRPPSRVIDTFCNVIETHQHAGLYPKGTFTASFRVEHEGGERYRVFMHCMIDNAYRLTAALGRLRIRNFIGLRIDQEIIADIQANVGVSKTAGVPEDA